MYQCAHLVFHDTTWSAKGNMIARRRFVVTSALALPGLLRAASTRFLALPQSFADLERKNGGRLGVAVLDTGSHRRTGYHADQRFPMCSTFKLLLAAEMLHRADTGGQSPDQPLAIPPLPLLGHSPRTEPHAGGTMTIAELCSAATAESDNTAANVLLGAIGGPAAYTRYARSLGDNVTRLDRNEPTLNTSIAGDLRDTTSPNATVHNLQRLVTGNALQPQSRGQLVQWMVDCNTGHERLRAGFPHEWRSGDKTGSNGEHTTNDIAVTWPTGRAPVFVAVYLTQCPGPETKRGAVIIEVARLVAAAL